MRIKFILNNNSWLSISKKIQEVKDFYAAYIPLEIDIEYTNFKNIPFKKVDGSDGSSGHEVIVGTEIVEPNWYNNNVTSRALGYDMVLFHISDQDKEGHVTSAGIRSDRDQGPIELTIFGGKETDHAYNQGVDMGSSFAFFACHEIAHGLYMIQGGPDNTHKYFYSTDPKAFFKELKNPTNADKVSILKKLLADALELLNQLLKKQKEMETLPPPTQSGTPYIDKLCLAIQKHEGWYKGSRSYRNNNPGNLRYIGQQLAIGKDAQGFCIFKTYEDGYQTLKTMLLNAAKGYSKVYKPDMTLLQFFNVYAPSFDNNNPDAYAVAVAKDMGVTIAFRLKNVL